MKYNRFEDLPVWQAAAQLSADIIDWPMIAHSAESGIWPINCSGLHCPSPITSLKDLNGEPPMN